jgi:peptidoglycan/xylan/chitin deacetylase (PgdA/CDA1 family)
VRDLITRRRADAPAYLGVDDLRLPARRGWTIGGHGRDHHRLTDVDDDAVRHELGASVDLLDRLGKDGERVFAYPDGAHDVRVSAMVLDAGFELAFTVEAGGVTAATSPLAVPRLFARGDGEMPHPLLGAL